MFGFFLHNLLLGTGLAMDAFSVSIANALREPEMKCRRMCLIAGVYALFQALMPLAGRSLILAAAMRFEHIRQWIPWTGGGILIVLGGQMIRENLSGAEIPSAEGAAEGKILTAAGVDMPTLLLQGFATSVDALSAGFAFAAYSPWKALTAAGIIAAVTYCVCLAGLAAGCRLGGWASERAGFCGGVLLMGIGMEMLFHRL